MIMSILQSVISEASIAPFVSMAQNLYSSYKIAFLVALAVICLVVGFFGRRISGVVRVVLLFAVGFIAAMYWATHSNISGLLWWLRWQRICPQWRRSGFDP